MNGFIRKRMWAKAVLLLCGGTTLAATGCFEYKDLVDPCYPDRYNYMAEMEVNGPFATQVGKGHMLDQTVWNYYFEPGTDRLNGMGLDHLARLSRRLPQPDTLLFLQTAQITTSDTVPKDLIYDPANPDKLAGGRQDLDARRIAAVQRFMMAQTAGRGYDFQVAVIDPSEIGLAAIPVTASIRDLYGAHFKGNLGTGGASASGGGGATGGGGGGSSGGSGGGAGGSR